MMVKAVLQDCTCFTFKPEEGKEQWTVVRGTYKPDDETYLCVNGLGVEKRFRCDAIVYKIK